MQGSTPAGSLDSRTRREEREMSVVSKLKCDICDCLYGENRSFASFTLGDADGGWRVDVCESCTRKLGVHPGKWIMARNKLKPIAGKIISMIEEVIANNQIAQIG